MPVSRKGCDVIRVSGDFPGIPILSLLISPCFAQRFRPDKVQILAIRIQFRRLLVFFDCADKVALGGTGTAPFRIEVWVGGIDLDSLLELRNGSAVKRSSIQVFTSPKMCLKRLTPT